MEHRAPIHNQGQLISAAATAIPALGTKRRPSRIPSPATDPAQGWGPPGAGTAQRGHRIPTALSNVASLSHDTYPIPEGPQHLRAAPQNSQDPSRFRDAAALREANS